MKVQEHHTLDELKRLAVEHRGTILATRLQAVILARQNSIGAEIARALGFSRKAVAMWVSQYNYRGLEGLVDRPRRGRPCELKPQQLAELKARLDQGSTPEDGVSSLRGRDVQRIVEEQFGVLYCLNNIYDLLHRLGYSYLKPRPRHEKADPEVQEAFKKRSCPKSSGRFKPPIPKSL